MGYLILGIDGGLAHLGWSLAHYEKGSLIYTALGVIVTKPTDDKSVYKSDDDIRRARELTTQLNYIINSHTSMNESIAVICIEDMSFMRNAAAAAKLKMSHGVVAALSVVYNIPVLGVAPQALKKAVTGNDKASKNDVIHSLLNQYPALKIAMTGIGKGDMEHCFDAAGAIHASEERAELKRIKKLS